MASHKPIAAPLAPSPAPSSPTKAEARKPCLGCGGPEHGSVGVGIACLEMALVAARQENLRLRGIVP